jgi:hypothetical protein
MTHMRMHFDYVGERRSKIEFSVGATNPLREELSLARGGGKDVDALPATGAPPCEPRVRVPPASDPITDA